jgi:hypothetical protein
MFVHRVSGIRGNAQCAPAVDVWPKLIIHSAVSSRSFTLRAPFIWPYEGQAAQPTGGGVGLGDVRSKTKTNSYSYIIIIKKNNNLDKRYQNSDLTSHTCPSHNEQSGRVEVTILPTCQLHLLPLYHYVAVMLSYPTENCASSPDMKGESNVAVCK